MSIKKAFENATSTLFSTFDEVLSEITIVEETNSYDPATSSLSTTKATTTFKAVINPVRDIKGGIINNRLEAKFKYTDFPFEFTSGETVVYSDLSYSIVSNTDNGFVVSLILEQEST